MWINQLGVDMAQSTVYTAYFVLTVYRVQGRLNRCLLCTNSSLQCTVYSILKTVCYIHFKVYMQCIQWQYLVYIIPVYSSGNDTQAPAGGLNLHSTGFTTGHCSRLHYTVLYSTVLYFTILYYTVLYSTVLYFTILYSTVLYSTVLYSTVL